MCGTTPNLPEPASGSLSVRVTKGEIRVTGFFRVTVYVSPVVSVENNGHVQDNQ